jgi:ComF family protein
MPAIPAYPVSNCWEQALDLVFPPLCVGCRRIGRWICPHCWPHVAWLYDRTCGMCGVPSGSNPCLRCHTPSSPIRTVVAVAEFADDAREAVHALKYEGRHAISGMMGRLMASTARDIEAQAVVPLSLHASRRRERGYDQARLLAKAVAVELQVPYRKDGVERIRKTRQQATLSADDRRANVQGAFRSRLHLQGQTVLLVDDVCTTGATLESAAHALRDVGAGQIVGLVFAVAERGTVTPGGRVASEDQAPERQHRLLDRLPGPF